MPASAALLAPQQPLQWPQPRRTDGSPTRPVCKPANGRGLRFGEEEEVESAPGSDLTDTTGDIDIMAIAPNPTTTNTTVKIGSKRNQTITLEVYDLGGRKVATLFNQRAEADVAYILNFGADALESGVYTVRLSSRTEQVVEKLIVGK